MGGLRTTSGCGKGNHRGNNCVLIGILDCGDGTNQKHIKRAGGVLIAWHVETKAKCCPPDPLTMHIIIKRDGARHFDGSPKSAPHLHESSWDHFDMFLLC